MILKLYQKKISDGSLLGLVCRGEMSNLINMEVCMKVLFFVQRLELKLASLMVGLVFLASKKTLRRSSVLYTY